MMEDAFDLWNFQTMKEQRDEARRWARYMMAQAGEWQREAAKFAERLEKLERCADMTKFMSDDEKRKEITTPPITSSDLKIELLKAFDRITKLETVIDQVEWVDVPPVCPWCRGYKHYGGHYSGCMRQSALER